MALLALTAGACRGDGPPEPPPTDTPTGADGTEPGGGAGTPTGTRIDGTLRIGTVLPQSGELATLGPSLVEAVRLAVEDINAAGGVLGKDIELRLGDSGSEQDTSIRTLDELRDGNVDAIVGAASARVSLAIMERVTRSQTVMCSPANTGLEFTSRPDNGFYFRTAQPDGLQALALADVIVGDGHRRIGIISVDDDFGRDLSAALRTALEAKEDVSVVGTATYPPDAREFASRLRGLVQAEPDAVAIVAFEDTGAPVISALIEEGMGPGEIGVYAPDAMQRASLGELASPDDPSAVQGVKGTAPLAEGLPRFADAFREFAPENTPEIFSAHAYDCVVLMALAALETNTDDPVAMSGAMTGLTKEGVKCRSFEQCKELIENGEDIDYDGASGELDFTDVGEPGSGRFEVWEYVVRGDVGRIRRLGTLTAAVEEDETS
ncbi:MAG: ABC transporter substrate-binding protein [Nitriliruptorales bacterium]